MATHLRTEGVAWLEASKRSRKLRMAILKGLFDIFQAGETDPHLIIIGFAIELLENLAIWQLICVHKELLGAKVP